VKLKVTGAAEERQVRRIPLQPTGHLAQTDRLIWLLGLALETLPSDRAGEFYEEAADGRSASHHLQVKAPQLLWTSGP